MATISNPNDPNRNASGAPSTPAPAPIQVSTANVAPQQASTSGTPTGTGQFSTLQKYLGANQGAGQRLGNAIGGNLSNEATGLANATNTALSNSTDANKKQADLTNNTNSFTTALNAPSTAPTTAAPSIGYDVSKYGTNLSGTQAAAEIANNANKTKSVRDAVTGTSGTAAETESNKQAQAANEAAAKAANVNSQRQKDINDFNRRGELLQDALNSKNQRAGIKNLDNAFLSQDKSGTLNQINQNLQGQVAGLQNLKTQANVQQSDVKGLTSAQNEAATNLNNRLSGMNSEYMGTLDNRVKDVNTAKDARMSYLNDSYNKFRDTGEINKDLYDMLHLGGVTDADALARAASGAPVSAQKTTNGVAPVHLWNTLANTNLGSSVDGSGKPILDTSLLSQRAMKGEDVANTQDVTNLSNLSKLLGRNNAVGESKFVGRQIGDAGLTDALNNQNNSFVNNANNIVSAQSHGDYKHNGDWYNSVASANASLADMLYKDKINKTFGYARGGGGRTSLDSVVDGALTNPYDSGSQLVDKNNSGNVSNVNYTPSENYATNFGNVNAHAGERNNDSFGQAANVADEIATAAVKNNLNNKLNTMGYQNLLKLVGQGEEY